MGDNMTGVTKDRRLRLASLFDGSGGFPLGGMLAGIEPVWASEVEPFPIRVTTKRIPKMKHYGDVSKIDGAAVEPVDIITFGSPCQDMSVAGKRAGLDGNRSGLFYQAIRIIKEMRGATNGLYPRYAVWENVPGAFTSNAGQDFRAVLEELCRVKDPGVTIPMPEKWRRAGLIMGDGYSIAWRQLDAQYWGVPQRRKRIYLVADFSGESAGKILFESESVSGYSSPSRSPWKRIARNTTQSVGETVVLNDQGGERMEVTKESVTTLRAEARHPPVVCEGCDPYNGDTTGEVSSTLGVNCGMSSGRTGVVELKSAGFCTEPSAKARDIGYEEERSPTLRTDVVPAVLAIENHPTDSRVSISKDGVVETLTSRMGTGGNNVPLLLKIRQGQTKGGGKGILIQENKSATLSCGNDQTLFEPCGWDGGQVSPTLTRRNANGCQHMPDKDNFNCVLQAYGISSQDSNAMKSSNPHSGIYEADTSRTLDCNGGNPTCNQGGMCVVGNYSVRRLTPMECARLQGFPDTWCDDLETPNPTKEDLDFWRGVFKTYTDMTGTKMKTDAQIIKWLQAPHSDSAEYKMWGNGVALPCVVFVMSGIAWAAKC